MASTAKLLTSRLMSGQLLWISPSHVCMDFAKQLAKHAAASFLHHVTQTCVTNLPKTLNTLYISGYFSVHLGTYPREASVRNLLQEEILPVGPGCKAIVVDHHP